MWRRATWRQARRSESESNGQRITSSRGRRVEASVWAMRMKAEETEEVKMMLEGVEAWR